MTAAAGARQLVVDAGRDEVDPALILGDVTVLEWIWDRVAHVADEDLSAQLDDLRAAADDEDVASAADIARTLAR